MGKTKEPAGKQPENISLKTTLIESFHITIQI